MEKEKRDVLAALGVLATHNVVQNYQLTEKGYVGGNLAVSALLVGLARSAGLSWAEMGLVAGDSRANFELTGIAVLTAAAGIGFVAIKPGLHSVLQDERLSGHTSRDAASRVLVRFPIGTALFEEVAFRGVLSGLLWRSHRPVVAEILSGAAFGLWHIIPTRNAVRANPSWRDRTPRGRVVTIAAGCLVTGIAGLGFSLMRRRAGSLVAPWLAHASFNGLAYLAARRVG